MVAEKEASTLKSGHLMSVNSVLFIFCSDNLIR